MEQKQTNLQKILEMVHKSQFRINCKTDLEAKFGKINLCSYHQSYLLRKVGILDELFSWTKELSNKLRLLKWKKITDPTELKEGDICFSKDLDKRLKSPDHTYMFIKWYDKDKLLAMIWDNYNKEFTIRNIGGTVKAGIVKYAKTPFDWAYRCQD
jgi:hypothetical protein